MMTTDLDVIHEIRKNLDSRQYDVLDSEQKSSNFTVLNKPLTAVS
jgi:hypothetical protein